VVEKADNSHLISEYQLKINPTPNNNNNLPHPSLLAPTSVDLEHTKKNFQKFFVGDFAPISTLDRKGL